MVRNGPKLFAAVAGVVATVAVFRAVTTDDAGALPTYTLTMSGGTSKVRSATVSAAPVPMFAPGTRFEVILRPEEPARGEVVFAARYEVGATSTPWTPPAELSAAGTVRISGMSEDVLPRTRGELTLVFFIGRSKEVAAASQRTSSGGGADTHEPGLSIFRRRVIIASGPE
jgi:hypothetical protein